MSKTPISILQELMVQRKEALPDYTFEESDMPQFRYKCNVRIGKMIVSGYATTKKEAKQKGAQVALEKLLKYKLDSNNNSSKPQYTLVLQRSAITLINYVGQLNELSSMNGKRYPIYHENIVSATGIFKILCTFLGLQTEGYGSTKKEAKQDAARKMIECVNRDKDCLSATVVQEEKQENINRFAQEIIKRLEQTTHARGTINKTITLQDARPQTPIIVGEAATLDELRKQLANHGLISRLEEYQSNPYIMCLQINDSNCVFMGNGKTKDEALNDLFVTMYTMCSYGFSFSKSFL